MYKQLRLYINLYIKKQHGFLLRNNDLCSIHTFQISQGSDVSNFIGSD